MKKLLERAYASRIAPLQVYVVRGKVSENFAPYTSPADYDVEPPLTTVSVYSQSSLRDIAFCRPPVANTDEYNISLITLYCFQVLHENGSFGWPRKSAHTKGPAAAVFLAGQQSPAFALRLNAATAQRQI